MNEPSSHVGIVAIGRNEGDRFKRCLLSLKQESERIVYVDSGSTDDSVKFARNNGAHVVVLDKDKAFTAARARNAGFAALQEQWPDTENVFFIDGDCELVVGFVEAAISQLMSDRAIGVVTGRCRERRPDATIYNRLCEIEWRGPVGDIKACGGIFVTRAHAFQTVDGFRENIIAAEDDDFCIRIRSAGLRIVRIDQDMCLHDADIRKFGQWWRRMERAGHAFAQLGELHDGYFRSERLRSLGWGGVLPAVSLLSTPFTNGLSLFLLLLYPLSLARTRTGLIKRGVAPAHATLGAFFLTLAKVPNFIGMLKYKWKKRTASSIGIVEYK
ncbi:glycosyltransferase family 2 protein [Hyphococcus flavus]|uniref:Glycosyltransferase family 2 protein n=1 Tax=Hyphococcus flavus TaxID=1866326 RepID=A0AAF0CG94_9PROT|nr:glycosyltransferase family 2 protein [Hyphococcus flavus]WDI32099.1 glycosyltransferase family 2 protein [Hyphococcus flavus]